MKLGAKTVDTFMTSSQQNKVPVGTFVASDEKGMVITPLKLKAGRYRIEEIEAPQGYLLEKEPIWVDIQKSHVVSEDEDRDAYIDVEIMDKKPTGTLELKKEFENLSDETCHRPVRFRLSAGADILNPANGEVLYHAGDPVSVNGAQEGIYELGKDSILRISGLPLGLEQSVYHLEEIETLEGYLLPEAGMDFVFKKADDHTLTYVVCKNLKNKKMHLTTQVQGTKVFDSNQKMWIRDVVNYQQLDSHKTYRLEGTIVDKRTGKPVVIQNKIVRHDLTFVPDPEHPYIENIFVLDAHTLPQGEYVIYEKLYCDQGHLLAFHEDLHDAAQSFQVLPLYVVEVKKVDAQTNKVILNQPFSFSLRKKEKTEMDIKNVKPMWNQGIVSFSGVSNGIWLLQEKSVPEGYMLDTHVYQLRIQGENVWLDGKPVKIKDGIIQISISNRKKKPVLTGVLFGFSSGLLWFGLSGLLLILIFVLQLWRKKSL